MNRPPPDRTSMRSHTAAAFFAALLAFGPAAPIAAAEIDPEADRILKEMSDHLSALGSFAIEADVVTEAVLRDGRKIQLLASGEGVMDRDRGFRFARKGSDAAIEVVYDGAVLTLFDPGIGWVALPVEGGPDAAFDEARAALGTEVFGGVDLLYANPYEGLNYEVESAAYLGETWVGEVRAHHLSYRAAEIDWQLWVSAEAPPLPLKYVITSKWMTAAPQFSVRVRRWQSAPEIAEDAFAFAPPEGAAEVDPDSFIDRRAAETE